MRGSVVEMPDEGPQKALWEVRKAGLNIMMSLKGDGKPVSFIEDCAVPLVHLAEYTDALTEVFHRHGTRGTWYAHASVGTLHVRPILDMRRDGAAKMRAIAEEQRVLANQQSVLSATHAERATKEAENAQQQSARAQTILAFLTALLENAGDLVDQGKNPEARRSGPAAAPP